MDEGFEGFEGFKGFEGFDEIVTFVTALGTAQIRRTFLALRNCEARGAELMGKFLPEIGLLVGEFTTGHVLRGDPRI